MKPLQAVWRDVGHDSGFLALTLGRDRDKTELALHVAAARAEGRTVAWWEMPEGHFVCFAEVGEA